MRAILNNKLYDTEKAEFLFSVSVPLNDFHETVNEFNVYKTAKGNIFAEHKNTECLVGENVLKTVLSEPDCVDIYIRIFGEVEEA